VNFKIPQDVEIEDKIFSFLTMRQLIILVIWGGIAYLNFITMAKYWFLAPAWWPASFFISVITLLIAFLKLNHLEFHRWVVLFIARFLVPQKRYWINNYSWSLYFDFLCKNSDKKSKNNVSENDKDQASVTFKDIVNKLWASTKKQDLASFQVYEADADMREELEKFKY